MKTRLISVTVLILFGLIVITTSCQKEVSPSQILYPEEGYFGHNLLSESQFDITLSNDKETYFYSLRAELPENANLRIVINDVIHPNWAMMTGSSNGCVIKNENGTITFYADGPEVCDGGVRFDKNGANTIEIYENFSSEPNRIKSITY